MEDHKIIELYVERNELALKETSIKYGTKLRNIAVNIVCNSLDAEECENDTYLTAWNTIPPHKPEKYFFAYLAKIIRNFSLDKYRAGKCKKRNAVMIELTTELENCIPNATLAEDEDKEFIDHLNSFLETLKEVDRIIFIRRYWYLESICQIAEKFNFSENKIKSMLFRTRNKLKNYLAKECYHYECR